PDFAWLALNVSVSKAMWRESRALLFPHRTLDFQRLIPKIPRIVLSELPPLSRGYPYLLRTARSVDPKRFRRSGEKSHKSFRAPELPKCAGNQNGSRRLCFAAAMRTPRDVTWARSQAYAALPAMAAGWSPV